MTPRAWNALLRGGALVAALLGAVLCWSYVEGAILERLGEPDQSLAFWYLPLLFLGLGGLAAGVVLWLVARERSRGTRRGP